MGLCSWYIDLAAAWTFGNYGFYVWLWQDIFLFSNTSLPLLRPIQWAPEPLHLKPLPLLRPIQWAPAPLHLKPLPLLRPIQWAPEPLHLKPLPLLRPIQWAPEPLHLKPKWLWQAADSLLPSCAKVINECSCTFCPFFTLWPGQRWIFLTLTT